MAAKLSYKERKELHFKLIAAVKEARVRFLGLVRSTSISDTIISRGHESSTIDNPAKAAVELALNHHFPGISMLRWFESEPYRMLHIDDHNPTKVHGPLRLYAIIDELDGTTNAKRSYASSFEYEPRTCISIALSTTPDLGGLVMSAVILLTSGRVFSSLRLDANTFVSFEDERLLNPDVIQPRTGDSAWRVMVAWSSNSHVHERAEVEAELWKHKIKPYGGCRASGVDIIDVVRGQFDAYIDLRHYWPAAKGGREEAMLQVYDIAGSAPFALGAGLVVTDARGESWESYQYWNTIPLVIARPKLHEHLIPILKPFVTKWHGRKNGNSVTKKGQPPPSK